MVSIVGLISWCGIAFIYLRFHAGMKHQGLDRKSTLTHYRAWFQPYLGWYTLIFGSIICLFNAWPVFLKGKWSTADFICGYLPIPLFFIGYFGHKFWFKTKMIPYSQMDFESNSKEDDFGEVDEVPTSRLGRIWHAIV